MTIEPDRKDWTWVLHRPCEECGFGAAALDVTLLPARIHEAAGAWREVLRRPDVRERPDGTTWSALEYGCHVRDVFLRFDTLVEMVLTREDPEFPEWDQDAAAAQARYGEQNPGVVAIELREIATVLADRFAWMSDEQWRRPARRADGVEFTARTLGQYFFHEVIHHLWDVGAARRQEAGQRALLRV